MKSIAGWRSWNRPILNLPRWRALSLVLLLAFILAIEARAQNPPVSGAPRLQTLVPSIDARPAPSPLEQRHLTRRDDGDTGSIAELIRSNRGADGLMEVIVGRSRLITLQEPLATISGAEIPVVAVSDPTVLEFDILPSAQMIRILGRRVGMTDLSVITASGNSYNFEVHVVYDLNLLRAYLKQLFPTAKLNLTQMYEHVVVEGEAMSVDQTAQIIQTIEAYLSSAQVSTTVGGGAGPAGSMDPRVRSPRTSPGGVPTESPDEVDQEIDPETGAIVPVGTEFRPSATATAAAPSVINLLRVPGVQQVMLKVKIAEINRTALREMGTNLLYRDSSGRTFGTSTGSGVPIAGDDGGLLGLLLGGSSTSFAIFPNTSLSATFDALRSNQVVNILAEPNLMALHGQQASFLAGGEFPVPVPQNVGGGGSTFTVEFKEFGVLLNFVPYIMEDGAIRLHVAPEVSTIDQTIGVVSAGVSIPGVNTRRANTTVELRQGQTLALAGLIQVELDAATARVPGLGDLPYIGALFANNTHRRVEKELIILVSPYLVSPLEAEQVGPLPGACVQDPDDYEFYLLNRIESRHSGVQYRATNGWDDPLNIRRFKMGHSPCPDHHVPASKLYGPYGFSR